MLQVICFYVVPESFVLFCFLNIYIVTVAASAE